MRLIAEQWQLAAAPNDSESHATNSRLPSPAATTTISVADGAHTRCAVPTLIAVSFQASTLTFESPLQMRV